MRVLVFGWEFPPHISGGLGTACHGIVNALLKKDTEIFFVVPKASGDEAHSAFMLINASGVDVNGQMLKYQKKFTYIEAVSQLVPYVTPENGSTCKPVIISITCVQNILRMEVFTSPSTAITHHTKLISII